MAGTSKAAPKSPVLLVYYSPDARQRIEEMLRSQRLEVYRIDGRAADAVDTVRCHPAEVVVMDYGAGDVSVGQAVRQVGQILPRSLVVAVHPSRAGVDIYRGGHRIGVAESLETALRQFAFHKDPNGEGQD